MTRKYIITAYKNLKFLCVTEDGRPAELDFDEDGDIRIGNIYIAKVIDVVKNINAAFVDIGIGVKCFLPLDESQSGLHSQDELMVQVKKEAVKSKGITVTDDISVAGEYIALSLKNKTLGISRKIEDEGRRAELKALFAGVDSGEYGIVVRTNAAGAPDENILAEYEKLRAVFEDIMQKSRTRTCFSCIYEAPSFLEELLRDEKSGRPDEIITDLKDVYEELSAKYPMRFYEDDTLKLIKLYSLETCISEALQKKVWLKGGGYLVIEPTEAMTVIDVNSGKNTDKKAQREIILRSNTEAADEIARQLRLRNLSGMVMIDFINMADNRDVKLVMNALRKALSADPVKTALIDITKLGIVEVTRMKVRKPLHEILCQR